MNDFERRLRALEETHAHGCVPPAALIQIIALTGPTAAQLEAKAAAVKDGVRVVTIIECDMSGSNSSSS